MHMSPRDFHNLRQMTIRSFIVNMIFRCHHQQNLLYHIQGNSNLLVSHLKVWNFCLIIFFSSYRKKPKTLRRQYMSIYSTHLNPFLYYGFDLGTSILGFSGEMVGRDVSDGEEQSSHTWRNQNQAIPDGLHLQVLKNQMVWFIMYKPSTKKSEIHTLER